MNAPGERYEEHPEPVVNEYKLESTFQGLPIKVREIVAPSAKRLIIYAHGSFDEMDGHYRFYSNLFYKLAQDNIASTVQLNTARKPSYYRGDIDGITAAFEGKHFYQECDDVHKVIENSLVRLPQLVATDKPEIILVGLSLGGTLMAMNAYQFPQVSKLLLLSSGCRTQNGTLPMMDSYPDAQIIKNAAGQFKGQFQHITPGNDSVVPVKFQDELYDAFTHSTKSRIVIPHADHVYSFQKEELQKDIERFIES